MSNEITLKSSWIILKITYGLYFLIFGIDKFFNIIEHWEKYISPLLLPYLPLSTTHCMYFLGGIEIIIGLMILIKFTRLGAYLAMGLLILIVLNLFSVTNALFYDDAIRDSVNAVGAYVLAQLSNHYGEPQ